MLSILGDFMTDKDIFLKQTRKSPEGDWPIVTTAESHTRPGGAGAVAAMVRGMGHLAIEIGTGAKPKCLKKRYFLDGRQQFRIDTDFSQPIPPDTARCLVGDIPKSTTYLLLADYGRGVVTECLWNLLGAAGWHPKIIVDPSRFRPLNWYRGAAAILPNQEEAAVHLGPNLLSEAIIKAHELHEVYSHVCLKLGPEGMVAYGDLEACHIPPTCPPQSVVDPCGAGDMVLAAIGVGLLRGQSWLEACKFANRMAGLKCRQHGATPVMVK